MSEFATITEDFKHYFFIEGGALAVENALKCAFDWKMKKSALNPSVDLDVIHLDEAFHGRTGYTLSLTNTTPEKTDHYPTFGWSRISNPKTNTSYPEEPFESIEDIEENSLSSAEQLLQNGDVAAIILEPIQGEGGDNHFRKEFFQGLRKLADQYEAMLIFDEVQTGMGLTGSWWCYQHFGVVPDMIAFGKKTQVCGFCATSRIDEVKDNVFTTRGRINSTWGGSLLDMMRCFYIINIIKSENLLENAATVGYRLLERLRELPLKNVRGRGLMIAFDPPDRDEFYNKLSEKMICLKCGKDSIRLRPALTFSHKDADRAVEIITGCF